MSAEKRSRSLRVELGEDATEQLDLIKKKLGIETDSETVRYIINYAHERIVLGKGFPPMKITGKDIEITFQEHGGSDE